MCRWLYSRWISAHDTAGRALNKLLADKSLELGKVIELKVDEEALVERITGRYSCAKCGAGYHDKFQQPKQDDVCDVVRRWSFRVVPTTYEETVRSRLAAYNAQTAEIVPYYGAKGNLVEIDGMLDIGCNRCDSGVIS